MVFFLNGEYWLNDFIKCYNVDIVFLVFIGNIVVVVLGNEVKVIIYFGKISLEEDCFFWNIIFLIEYILVVSNGNVKFENCFFLRNGFVEFLVFVSGMVSFFWCIIKGNGGCGIVV